TSGSAQARQAVPLSLYQLMDPAVLADPYSLYRALRERERVYWDPFLHAWVVTGYAEVLTVLQNFSAERTPTPEHLQAMGAASLAPIAQVMVKQMLFLDGAAHQRLRRLCSVAFTSSRMVRLRSHIESIANRLIDRVFDTGCMDLINDFAAPLPAIVSAELLGVPATDHAQLKEWSSDFAEMLGNFQHNADRAGRVLRSLEGMAA